MDARDRRHAGDPAAGADDHLAVDVLAQDPVGRADVVGALGRDRRGLQPVARLGHRDRRPPRRSCCPSRAASRATGRSARGRAATLVTSGSSTRSDCSSSSCPVWSPSRTIMRRSSAIRRLESTHGSARQAHPDPNAAPGAASPVPPGDGFRAAEHPGARHAVFCRLEHVVPWSIQGAHWDAGEPDEPAGVAAPGSKCAHCEAADRRGPRPAHAPPRRIPRARRVLLGGSHGRVGEGRRELAVGGGGAAMRLLRAARGRARPRALPARRSPCAGARRSRRPSPRLRRAPRRG